MLPKFIPGCLNNPGCLYFGNDQRYRTERENKIVFKGQNALDLINRRNLDFNHNVVSSWLKARACARIIPYLNIAMVQSGDYYNKDTNPIGYITFGVAEIILWLGIICVSGCDDASHPPPPAKMVSATHELLL